MIAYNPVAVLVESFSCCQSGDGVKKMMHFLGGCGGTKMVEGGVGVFGNGKPVNGRLGVDVSNYQNGVIFENLGS